MLQGNQIWNEVFFGWVTQYGNYTLGSPVVVLDVTYFPIYLTYESSPGDPIYVGQLWENVSTEQVYFRENNSDHLLYDFNVQADDVINVWSFGTPTEITITNVQLVDINGEQRKMISYLQNEWFGGYYIEGIGSNNGLLDYAWANIADAGGELTCYYENEELIWSNPDFNGTCAIIQNVNELEKIEFDIFPNPAKTEINILFSKNILVSFVEITDISGRLISRENIVNTDFFQVDISSLPQGKYFLSLGFDSKIIGTLTFLKI